MKADKKVILHVITSLDSNGAQIMLYNLLWKTNRVRFEPIIISLMDRSKLGDRIEALNIPVYTLNMKQGIPSLAHIWKLIRLVGQLQPDLIQGWMYHGNLAGQVASLFGSHKIPVVWGIHHSINSLSSEKRMTQYIIRLGSILSKFTNQIAFVSKNSKLQHEDLGYCSYKSCIIPNGFNTELFKPSVEARKTFRAELGLPEECFLIGSIGRDHPMKDRANFLTAAALLLKDFRDVHFILVGDQLDRENDVLLQSIEEKAIGDRIHLLGERRDMPHLTAALDILTSSSAYGEAFPLVVGEAMSCGVPCVVTDVGDSAWIVGNTGRVVPPQNSEALANAWSSLILLSREDRQVLGEAARSRIIESFSLDSVVSRYEQLYESVLT